jgi:hypothetical protein
LAVVSRERNAEDILLVSNELSVADTGVDVPKTESTIPRARQDELSVRGDDNIRHKVVVAVESTTRNAEAVGVVLGQIPDDDGLVARAGDQDVAVLRGGGDGGHPARVTHHNATECDFRDGVGHAVGRKEEREKRPQRARREGKVTFVCVSRI